MLGPFVETLGYLCVLASFLLGTLDLRSFLLFLAVDALYGLFLSVAAVLPEEISFRRYPGWIDLCKLLVLGILANFGYRQLLALCKIEALRDVVRRRGDWETIERHGIRTVPAREPAPSE